MRYNNPYLRKKAAAGNLFNGGPNPATGKMKADPASLQQLAKPPTIQQHVASAAANSAQPQGNNKPSAQKPNVTPVAKTVTPVAAAAEKKPVTPTTPVNTQNSQTPVTNKRQVSAQQPKTPTTTQGDTTNPLDPMNYVDGSTYDNANDNRLELLNEGQPVVNENGAEPELSPTTGEETEEDSQLALQEKADQASAEAEQKRNQAKMVIENKGQTLGEDGETIYDNNGTPVGRLNADGTIEEAPAGMNPNAEQEMTKANAQQRESTIKSLVDKGFVVDKAGNVMDPNTKEVVGQVDGSGNLVGDDGKDIDVNTIKSPAENKRQSDASNAAKSGKYDTNIAGWYTDFKFEDPSSWIPRVLAGLLGAIVGGTLTDNPLGAVVGGALGWGAGGGVQKNWTQLFGSDAEKQALAAQQQQQEATALAAAKDFENDPDVQRAKALGLNPQEVYEQKKQRSALYQKYSDAIKAFKGLDPKSPLYEQAKKNLREMQRRLHQLKHSEFADKKYA